MSRHVGSHLVFSPSCDTHDVLWNQRLCYTVQYSTAQKRTPCLAATHAAARRRIAQLPRTDSRPASDGPACEGSVKSRGSKQEPRNSRFMQADHGIPRCLTGAKPTNLQEWLVTTHQTRTEATSSPTVSATLELRACRRGDQKAPFILRAVWCKTHQQTGPRSRSAFSVWLLLPTGTGGDAIISNSSVLHVALDIVGSTGQARTGPSNRAEQMRCLCAARQPASSAHATAQGSEIQHQSLH